MNKLKTRIRLLTAAALFLAAGCAPAYHSYSGCRVNCQYCPPCPLEYPHYQGCKCHSCAASKYLAISALPESPEIAITGMAKQ